MDQAVVEIVGGTIVDGCDCGYCQSHRHQQGAVGQTDVVFEFGRDRKIELLCDRLLGVLSIVAASAEGQQDDAWAVALELEPGPTYVVNNRAALGGLISALREEPDYKPLLPHVGINLDIAHMKIAGVEAQDLRRLKAEDWVIHAHICDHPRMHTRDQVVGSWNPVERYNSKDYPYLRFLAEIDKASPTRCGRPFTKTVALELEGCGRIGWIHQSLTAMKHMVEVVRHHRTRISLE